MVKSFLAIAIVATATMLSASAFAQGKYPEANAPVYAPPSAAHLLAQSTGQVDGDQRRNFLRRIAGRLVALPAQPLADVGQGQRFDDHAWGMCAFANLREVLVSAPRLPLAPRCARSSPPTAPSSPPAPDRAA